MATHVLWMDHVDYYQLFVFTGLTMSTIEIFQKYYSSMIQTLPMNDVVFFSNLYSNGFLPGNLRATIQSLATAADKAAKLLDEVIEPSIRNNDCSNFNKLMTIMKESNYNNVKMLARTISNSMPAHGQGTQDSSDG